MSHSDNETYQIKTVNFRFSKTQVAIKIFFGQKLYPALKKNSMLNFVEINSKKFITKLSNKIIEELSRESQYLPAEFRDKIAEALTKSLEIYAVPFDYLSFSQSPNNVNNPNYDLHGFADALVEISSYAIEKEFKRVEKELERNLNGCCAFIIVPK